MRNRRPKISALVLCAALSLWLCGCSSNTPASPTGPQLAHLRLDVWQAEAYDINWAGGIIDHAYNWCYNIILEPYTGPTRIVTILKVENTVIGPDGSIYDVSSSTFEGQKIGGSGTFGYFGCPDVYRDRSTRPIATTYRMRIDYLIEGERQTFTVSAGGTFTQKNLQR